MVDETLKRLLQAETEADRIVTRANEERQAIIEQAKRDARTAEQQHVEQIAEIRNLLLTQAEQRAQQTIATMQRRFDEQALALRAAADRFEQQALAEAITLLTEMSKK